jgi:polysaccharide export outer membrane protein
MARPLILLFIGFQIIMFGTSCTSTKNAVYFNDMQTATFSTQGDKLETIIQKNDILSITVTSDNAEASAIFNTNNNFNISSTTSTGNNIQSSGNLVNSDGNIEMPLLGDIKAAGLTKKQLQDNITKLILDKKLLIGPIVNIRQLNFEVTVLGEVSHPTVITVPSEKISLVKALGLAGDITIYGKKDNVMLIREVNGKRTVSRINLNSKDFFTSEYYYLQPNDVIYVEPNKNKVASASRGKDLLPAILSGLSIIVILLDRIIK